MTDMLEAILDWIGGHGMIHAAEGIFGSSPDVEVPSMLTPRNRSTLWLALLGLGTSSILIAMSNLGSNKLVSVFSRVLYKNATVEKIVQEEYSLKSISSFLLLINFVVTSTTMLYLSFVSRSDLPLPPVVIYFFPLLPLYFFLWPLIWFSITGFITGEQNLLSENRKNAILFAQIIGLCFAFILLVWTFNLRWSTYFTFAFLSLMIAFWVFKLLRGLVFAFQHRVPWYYILLYVATIEILPLVLLYHFVLLPLI